ncbi:MAG: hypothetical protein AB7P41_14525 [Dehalococcoidia bacterium]
MSEEDLRLPCSRVFGGGREQPRFCNRFDERAVVTEGLQQVLDHGIR